MEILRVKIILWRAHTHMHTQTCTHMCTHTDVFTGWALGPAFTVTRGPHGLLHCDRKPLTPARESLPSEHGELWVLTAGTRQLWHSCSGHGQEPVPYYPTYTCCLTLHLAKCACPQVVPKSCWWRSGLDLFNFVFLKARNQWINGCSTHIGHCVF